MCLPSMLTGDIFLYPPINIILASHPSQRTTSNSEPNRKENYMNQLAIPDSEPCLLASHGRERTKIFSKPASAENQNTKRAFKLSEPDIRASYR